MINSNVHFPKLTRRKFYKKARYYKAHRQAIREDCQGRCVYCDMHENEIGGRQYMTLDHFRPQDKYQHLINEPTNLLWSCKVCNDLKTNIWPAYGTSYTFYNNQGFIDPFKENMWDYFDVEPNGRLRARKPPANWLIIQLQLNRTGTQKARELRNQKCERKQLYEDFYKKAIREVQQLIDNPSMSEENKKVLLEHKTDLEKQHIINMNSCEIDFCLY